MSILQDSSQIRRNLTEVKGKSTCDDGLEVLSQNSKDMAKFLKMYRRLEAEQRFNGDCSGPQFTNLTNCNIYNVLQSSSSTSSVLYKGKENNAIVGVDDSN